jgi:CHAD domain-containing protein
MTQPAISRDDRSARLLDDRVTRVFRELPGAVAGHDEAVHQSRVAGRRLRVALPMLSLKSGGREVRHALKVLRALTRTVGAGRDLDVALGLLQDRLEALRTTSAEQRALLSRLRAARLRSRRVVAEGVFDLDIDGLRRSLRKLRARGPAGAETVLARLREFRERHGTALLRGFSQVGERYRPDALHALRRRIRKLRYAAELEDAVRGDETRAAALFKRLQDAIGVLHDHHVLALWLDEQARAAEARRNQLLARAARREGRAFTVAARLLHRALLETRPADLALRALMAMARSRSILSTRGEAA